MLVTTRLVAHEIGCSEMYYVPYVYISIHERSFLLQLLSANPCLCFFAPAAPAPLIPGKNGGVATGVVQQVCIIAVVQQVCIIAVDSHSLGHIRELCGHRV